MTGQVVDVGLMWVLLDHDSARRKTSSGSSLFLDYCKFVKE